MGSAAQSRALCFALNLEPDPMPQFVLNTPPRSASKRPHPFYTELNNFAQGYVEAMFFTNGDTGDDRENLLNEWGVECLTREAIKSIKADCERFEIENLELLREACALEPGVHGLEYAAEGLDAARCGNLFWYARQGHGVGWDDGGSAPCLERLQEASQRFGSATVEAYRKRIHHR